MSTSDPPVASFGRLATMALAHPAWPEDTRPQQRSLATLFSKLDREQDLDWLADRVEVQRILAELLHRPVADIQQALPVRRATATGRLIRLDDLRYGRELDLAREPLCPGIPPRVLEPSTWGCLVWQAPSGSGRSLAGAWLQARGLARHVVRTEALEDATELPSTGPLFLELAADELAPPTSEQWVGWLTALGTARRPVCVALSHAAPPPPWEVIHSPPIASVLPELVAWVAERLPEDGHFEPERALAWMQRVALPTEAVVTLGDALGLLGMLDEVRPRTLHGRSLDEVAETFVRQRLLESSEETTVSSWLSRNAFAALLGTIAQLIAESDTPWNRSRTFDEWLALIPEEYREGIDVEWMRAALARDASARLRSSDLASAARKLPPGGYQLLRAFEHARILVRDGERLRLRPHWLGTTLQARAAQELIANSPGAWSEALLRPAHAPRIVRALFDRALRGNFAPVHALLELGDAESPAHAAAVEACATVVGIVAAAGKTPPSDLVADLFAEQEHLALPFPGLLPQPRVAHELPAEEEPLLHRAAWLLGVYSLAEHVHAPRALLNPLRPDRPERQRQRLRDEAYPAFEALLRREATRQGTTNSTSRACVDVRVGHTTARYPWLLTIYSLVDDLRSALGPVSEIPLPVELPSAVAEALSQDRCRPELLSRLAGLPLALPALAQRVQARGLDWGTFRTRLWQCLDPERALPDFLDPVATDDPVCAELWRDVPPDWLKRRLARDLPVPWALLLPHHYAALLASHLLLPAEVARLAPLDALLEFVERSGLARLTPDARTALWRRAPQRLASVFDRLLDRRNFPEIGLALESVPDEGVARLLPSLASRIDLTTVPLGELHPIRRWLAAAIGRRVPGWHDAYALLHRIESALESIRRQLD